MVLLPALPRGLVLPVAWGLAPGPAVTPRLLLLVALEAVAVTLPGLEAVALPLVPVLLPLLPAPAPLPPAPARAAVPALVPLERSPAPAKPALRIQDNMVG